MQPFVSPNGREEGYAMIETFPHSARNTVQRKPSRGHYDTATIYPIIDEALICHVGFVQDGQPYVIPTLHARQGDRLLLHGSRASRLLRHVAAGSQVCITITLVDGIVLARSVFHHSINYRSVVIFGHGQVIADADERLAALEAFTERLLPGRWQEARGPNPVELKQTAIVAVPIDSASAKIRSGPPSDEETDMDLPVWAGVLPIQQVVGVPVPDPALHAGIDLPQSVRRS